MTRGFSRLLVGLVMVGLAQVAPQPVSATIVFDDHFTGNSGGMPEGWSLFVGPGTAVESGTTVTLDHDIIIVSATIIDPSTGVLTITWGIAGVYSNVYSLNLQLGNQSLNSAIAFGIGPYEEAFGLGVGARSGGEWQTGGWEGPLPGYTGGPIRLILVLGPTAFSLTCEDPPVSSGLLDYAAVFPTFTRADLGTACSLILENDAPNDVTAESIIDRITVDIGPPVSVEGGTFGQVKALFRR